MDAGSLTCCSKDDAKARRLRRRRAAPPRRPQWRSPRSPTTAASSDRALHLSRPRSRDVEDPFAPHRRPRRAPPAPLRELPRAWWTSSSAPTTLVLAIKMTLYRAGRDSLPSSAPTRPRRRQRQTGDRARRAQGPLRRGGQHPVGPRPQSGVHVVYGVLGPRRTRRCVSSSAATPRACAALSTWRRATTTGHRAALHRPSLFSARPELGDDATAPLQPHSPATASPAVEAASASPLEPPRLRAQAHRARGRARLRQPPARIVAKLNALVDPVAIAALSTTPRRPASPSTSSSAASAASPGVPGVSDRIRVVSGRRPFEHSRVVAVENGNAREIPLTTRPTGCRATSTAARR